MKPNKIIILLLFVLWCGSAQGQTNEIPDQTGQWELFLEDVHGPIAVDPTNSDIIYVSVRGTTSPAYPPGMLKSIDGGQNWEYNAEGAIGDPKDIWINPLNPLEVMASGSGVVRSTDGGESWKQAGYGIEASAHGSTNYKMAYDSRDSTWYLANDAGGWYGGVYHSKDGEHWENILHFPGTYSLLLDENHDVMYAGTGGLSYLVRSTDGGQSWEAKYEGMEQRVNHLVRVPGSKTIYAATSRGIYKSYDMAETWTSVSDTLMAQLVFNGGLAVSSVDTNTVFAGAAASLTQGGGLFVSNDAGDTWELYQLGKTDSTLKSIYHMHLDEVSNTLYANYGMLKVSEENGKSGDDDEEYHFKIYRLKNAVITGASEYGANGIDVEQPQTIMLHQNYPNPFNPVTRIRYSLSESSPVVLQVYDIMGRLVDTLENRVMPPGHHQVVWDGSHAASGIYLYRLYAGEQILTRRMMLVK